MLDQYIMQQNEARCWESPSKYNFALREQKFGMNWPVAPMIERISQYMYTKLRLSLKEHFWYGSGHADESAQIFISTLS